MRYEETYIDPVSGQIITFVYYYTTNTTNPTILNNEPFQDTLKWIKDLPEKNA